MINWESCKRTFMYLYLCLIASHWSLGAGSPLLRNLSYLFNVMRANWYCKAYGIQRTKVTEVSRDSPIQTKQYKTQFQIGESQISKLFAIYLHYIFMVMFRWCHKGTKTQGSTFIWGWTLGPKRPCYALTKRSKSRFSPLFLSQLCGQKRPDLPPV